MCWLGRDRGPAPGLAFSPPSHILLLLFQLARCLDPWAALGKAESLGHKVFYKRIGASDLVLLGTFSRQGQRRLERARKSQVLVPNDS